MKNWSKWKKTCSKVGFVVLIAVIVIISFLFFQTNGNTKNDGNNAKTESNNGKNSSSNTKNNKEVNYTLDVNGAKEGIDISDMLYGLFFEDINFAADGGLYAELVINRSFEFTEDLASNGALHGYLSYGDSELNVLDKSPLNKNNPHYLQITNSSKKSGGITNSGFLEGMSLTKEEPYRFTVYIKSDNYKGDIKVTLNNEKNEVIADGKIDAVTKEWTKYTVELTPDSTTTNGSLSLYMEGKGSIDVDMVSLFPVHTYKDRENGLRKDLVEEIKALKPSFIRFPGGCIVEGNSIENAYRWKDTIGDVAKRKQNYDLWKGTKEYPYYQSYGLGFYEYFQLCEDVGAKPVPVLNVGMSCQAQTGDFGYSEKAEDLNEYIQDALDLIEFCNGDSSTKWGKIRTDLGHKKPFDLEYIAIGNEQFEEDYFSRYEKFVATIRKEYPDIKIISTSGPASDGANYDFAWSRFKQHKDDEVSYVDIVDEHYYNSPEWFLTNTNRYDTYDRDVAGVFVGEYAAKSNNLYAAVSEAAYMTSLEKNSDVVKMASYAPLFGNTTSHQWEPDMIWFNNNSVFGSVNYYVQKMFSTNRGTKLIESTLSSDNDQSGALTGKVGVGTWKTAAVYDDVKIVNNDTGEVLYKSNFDEEDDAWKDSSQGTWKISDDDGNKVIGQKNAMYPTIDSAIMGSASYVGDTNWSNYTYTVRAKKIVGNEGFLIPFAVQDDKNFLHWNIGGWSDTQTAVERALGGTKTTITSTVPMTIKTNQWYDIKIVVTGNKVECYLDNKLIHSFTVGTNQGVYQTVSKDTTTGDVIIKLVNAGEKAKVTVNLNNITFQGTKATLEQLANENKNATNSMQNPDNVVPVTSEVEISNSFQMELPSYSVSILRVPTK